MMIRSLAAATALAAITLLLGAGCGGSSDQQQVSQMIETYLAAVARGDGDEACGQLTGEQARGVFEEAVLGLPELQATSCADTISKMSGSLGADEKGALEDAEATNVQVDGDSATAEVVGGTRKVELTKVDGHWLISGGLGPPS